MSDGSNAASAATAGGDISAPQDSIADNNADTHSADQTSDEYDGSFVDGEPSKSKKTQQNQVDDDPEFDFDGEKYKKSQLKEIAKRRKEFDAAAHKRFQEAAENRKALEAEKAEIIALANALKENPWALHEKMGINPDELAEQRLLAQINRARMTPEQIAKEEADQKQSSELQELRKFKETTEKQQKEQAHAQLVAQFKEHFDKQIATAIDKANLPRTLRSAQQVAKVMSDYMEMGEELDPVIAAQIVRNGYGKEISHEASELAKSNPQALIDMLGPDVVSAIVKSQVQKAQQFEPQKARLQAVPQTQKPKEPPDFDEVRRRLKAQGF